MSRLLEEPAVALISGSTGFEAYVDIRTGLIKAESAWGGKLLSPDCFLVLEVSSIFKKMNLLLLIMSDLVF